MRSTPAAMQTTLAGDSFRLVRLVELRLEQGTYRYALNQNDVTWNSQTWTATDGAWSELQESAQREVPQFTLVLQNLDGVLGALVDPLVGGKDPRGRRAVLREVTEADIADATATFSDTLVIVSHRATRGAVSFTVGVPWATQIMVPSRRIGGTRCQWVYKDDHCGSRSSEKACGKTVEDCAARFEAGEPLRHSNPPARVRTRRTFFV